MITVRWKCKALDQGKSGRAARRSKRHIIDFGAVLGAGYGGDLPVEVDANGVGSFRSPEIERSISVPGAEPRTYVFLFWSITGPGMPGSVSLDPFTIPVLGGPLLSATAWYVWDFGGGPGAHAVYVDAFNSVTGEFIDDDFVDVSPDDAKQTLTLAANETGYVDTSEIPEGSVRQVISRDPLHHGTWRHIWDKWIGIEIWPYARIRGQAISIRSNAVMVAIAIYGAKHDIPPDRQHGLTVTVVTGHAGGVVIVIPGPGVPPIPPFWDSIRHDVLVGLAQKLESLDAKVNAVMRKSKANDAN